MIPVPFIYAACAGLAGFAIAGAPGRPCCPLCRRSQCDCPPLLHRAPFYSCSKFPWLEDDIDHVANVLWEKGVCDLDELTRRTMDDVYPVTPSGEPIRWPSVDGDCAQILAIEARVRLRVEAIVHARLDMEAADIWEGY